MNFKILNAIGPVYTKQARDILSSFGVVHDFSGSQEEFEKKLEDYDALVTGLNFRLTREALSNSKKLKVVATATTGLDHIDLDTADRRSILVLSLRGEDEFLNTISGTAELAFGLILSLARFIPASFQSVLDGKWERENFRGHNLLGKNLGVIGLGRLGRMVARYGVAFGMRVLYSDPHVTVSPNKEYQHVTTEELLENSDFVSLHVHLSPSTKHLINSKSLGLMKPTSYLINTSRGEIVDEVALLSALEKSMIAGYGTDVLTGELAFVDNKIEGHPLVEYARSSRNLIVVPHIGGMTVESREATDVFIANKLRGFLSQDQSK